MTRFREPFPILAVDDVDRAVSFYRSVFGFEQTFAFEDDGATAYAFLRLEPLGIGIARRTSADDDAVALWVYADDVDAAAARLRANGASELLPPTDQPWGERLCTFRDPEGHLLHVGSTASETEDRPATVPRVGVGCVVRRGDEILLIRRRGPHGAGEWSTPGGFLEHGEDPAACVVREAGEETGLEVEAPRFLGVTNDVFEEEGRHSVTLWYEVACSGGEFRPSEEVADAAWVTEEDLPEPLFLSFRNFLDGRFLR